MNKPLLPLTKLVLTVSAIVLTVFGLELLFAPRSIHNITWPPPFEPIPAVWMHYDGVTWIALALGALYSLRQNNWLTARTYLVIAGPMVAMQVIVTVITALIPPGVPAIVWLYFLLAIIYLPIVFVVWRQESARFSEDK